MSGWRLQPGERRLREMRDEAKSNGLVRFSTGKPCEHGHSSDRYAKDGRCVECARGRTDAYKMANLESLKAKARVRTAANKDKNSRKHAAWRKNNPDRILGNRKAYYEKNKTEIIEKANEWRETNKERFRATSGRRSKVRRQTDFEYRLKCGLRGAMWSAIRRGKGRKSQKTLDMLGCSVPEFKAHIERQWLQGMSWANYGCRRGQWQFDHIHPYASFDLSDPVQQRKCFHYTNYQPLWWIDNIRKRDQHPVVYAQSIGMLL